MSVHELYRHSEGILMKLHDSWSGTVTHRTFLGLVFACRSFDGVRVAERQGENLTQLFAFFGYQGLLLYIRNTASK